MTDLATPGQSWLDYRHPEFTRYNDAWNYTRDHYSGEVLLADRLTKYLIRKSIGESDEAYNERVKLVDFTPHLATIIDSLVGMQFQNDDKTTRTWGKGERPGPLGIPTESASTMGRVWRDADGAGNGWLTLWKAAAIELLLTRRVWVVADSLPDIEPVQGCVKIIPATCVPNWIERGGRVIEALVEETGDSRDTLEVKPKEGATFIRYRLDGWQRYQKDEKGNPVPLDGDENAGTYEYRDQARRRVCPIFLTRLPISRDVGWLLARKSNAIFNQESARDNLLRLANFPKLVLFANDTLFSNIVNELAKGANALQADSAQGAHAYIAPPSGPAEIASNVIKRKVEELYITGFREYGDAAREKTATETRQDVAAGVGALLSLLATALDSCENGALFRLAQTQDSKVGTGAFVARVERGSDFSTVDPEKTAQTLVEKVFGKDTTVPLGRTAMIEAANELSTFLGLTVDKAQLEAAVDAQNVTKLVDSISVLSPPASVRVKLLERFLVATGLVGEKDTVKMADGSTKPALAAILEEAQALADAEDKAKRRASEILPGEIPEPDPPKPPTENPEE